MAFGIPGVLSTERTLGSGRGVGNGTRLVIGSTSGRVTRVGSSSGEAVAGIVGRGRSVGIGGSVGAAASGVRGAEVHATDKTSAQRTTRRTVNLPCTKARNSLATRPVGRVDGWEGRCRVHRAV
jgi:hypothetical protein